MVGAGCSSRPAKSDFEIEDCRLHRRHEPAEVLERCETVTLLDVVHQVCLGRARHRSDEVLGALFKIEIGVAVELLPVLVDEAYHLPVEPLEGASSIIVQLHRSPPGPWLIYLYYTIL